MKLLRLRGRKICDQVQRKGGLWKGKHMTMRWLPGTPRHPDADPKVSAIYVGTVASTKLHKSAVKRNRMRRRCREALRVMLKTFENVPTIQLLLSPRSSSLSAPFGEIQMDIRMFLLSLHGRSKEEK